jgi:hypothetical protein
MKLFWILILAVWMTFPTSRILLADKPWQMHVIDNRSKGADGVRLADLNQDERPDIVTGWEQGGIVRVYLNPGPEESTNPWPAVTVGKAPNVEDAVFVDLDGNGMLDIVSSCEGKTQSHFVHWAPKSKSDLLDPKKWKTEPIPVTAGKSRWMFCLPFDVDGKLGTDLIVGSKEPNGQIGWLESPPNPRDLASWKYHRLQTAGWIMSLREFDVDGDGDADILVSDRKGKSKGVYWLESNPPNNPSTMTRHEIAGRQNEVMFLDAREDSSDRSVTVVTPTRNGKIFLSSKPPGKHIWNHIEIPNPDLIPNGKASALGDINLDGKIDIVHTTNTGGLKPRVPGVSVLLQQPDQSWIAKPVSSTRGIKFDRIELIDLDNDGDLDVLTCEENDNLGVIWYENPIR